SSYFHGSLVTVAAAFGPDHCPEDELWQPAASSAANSETSSARIKAVCFFSTCTYLLVSYARSLGRHQHRHAQPQPALERDRAGSLGPRDHVAHPRRQAQHSSRSGPASACISREITRTHRPSPAANRYRLPDQL